MGRLPRAIDGGLIYRALDRGNNRADVFAEGWLRSNVVDRTHSRDETKSPAPGGAASGVLEGSQGKPRESANPEGNCPG
jgi:hypothetical protein